MGSIRPGVQHLQAEAARGTVNQLTFNSLFALAEDWDASALARYAAETAKFV